MEFEGRIRFRKAEELKQGLQRLLTLHKESYETLAEVFYESFRGARGITEFYGDVSGKIFWRRLKGGEIEAFFEGTYKPGAYIYSASRIEIKTRKWASRWREDTKACHKFYGDDAAKVLERFLRCNLTAHIGNYIISWVDVRDYGHKIRWAIVYQEAIGEKTKEWYVALDTVTNGVMIVLLDGYGNEHCVDAPSVTSLAIVLSRAAVEIKLIGHSPIFEEIVTEIQRSKPDIKVTREERR